MDPIYVTGHRNPDTDSIVSAMAYAALRNALGDREYRAARLGHVSDETQLVLDRFGFPAPVWIKTMRTQVRDLDYDTPPALSSGVTISRAWAALSTDTSIAALPITNEDGTLFGMLSSGDIAASDMQSIEHPHIDAVPLFNVLSVLEGRILNEAGDLVDSISGDVCIALPQSCDNLLFSGSGSIIVCGHQPDMVRRAHRAARPLRHRLSGRAGRAAPQCADGHRHHLHAVRCLPRRPPAVSVTAHQPHLPHEGPRVLPSRRLCRRRPRGYAEKPLPLLSHSG